MLIVCLVSVFGALLMGQGCPAPMMPGLGIWGYGNGTMPMLLHQQFTSAPFTASFSPTEANATICIVVSANDPASRPAVTVTDPSANVVAELSSPSNNVAEVTFVAPEPNSYVVSVTETGAAATVYPVTVTQAWDTPDATSGVVWAGGMLGGGWGGSPSSVVLRQTFTTAPFSATVSASETGERLRVVVSGNNAGSRLSFTVTDPSGMVAASVTTPTTNVSQVTFDASTARPYTIAVTETGTPSTSYLLRVM